MSNVIAIQRKATDAEMRTIAGLLAVSYLTRNGDAEDRQLSRALRAEAERMEAEIERR